MRPRSVRRPSARRRRVEQLDLLGADREALAIALQQVGDADEAGDELVARPLVELHRRAHLLDPPVVEDGDPVAHRQRLVLIVGDVDEGDPDLPLDRLQLHLHLLAQLQVQRPQRLVQQQHLGPVDDRPRQRHPLALPAAQLGRLAIRVAGQPHHRQRLVAPPRPLLLADAADPQPVLDVRPHAHVGEERVVLEDRVDRPVIGRHPAHVLAGQLDPPRARLLEPGDHPQRRRLAGAARPQQREELPPRDLQVNSRNRHHLAVVLGESLQADVGRCSSYIKKLSEWFRKARPNPPSLPPWRSLPG